MRLTFVDAGVRIAAARGGSEQAQRALAVLDDPEREFAASPFLRLEVLPQAAFNKRVSETAFYEAFFAGVKRWASDADAIVKAAEGEAPRFGVEAMDALQVVAAASVGAEEPVTTEKLARSIPRARAIRVVTIYPVSE